MSIIQTKDVKKWFGDFQALKGISMDVAEGEVLVIAGPSGSGKSTFIRCINSCLLYTSPSPRDRQKSRMPSSA